MSNNCRIKKEASYERKMAKLEIEKILAKKSTQAFLVYVLEDKVEIIEI
ncbi:TPA: hypothetical protein RZK20_001812 [Campylobacter coli]|nr:hypothetical protein [Campylobacter coli]HEB9345243.1 hypothetical protein [Campylobacter coli]HEB9431670.1 hypothetical protein [Campylobacter coli]